MKAKHFFIVLVSTINFLSFSQNVISDQFITSGGFQAGALGSNNTFYGTRAGRTCNGGSEGNTFIGTGAGDYSTESTYNTAIGYNSGANNNGNNNVFLGTFSGQENLTGNNNTIIGTEAGFDNSNYSGNIFLGYKAGYNESSDNKLYIENTDTQTPLIWGDFAQDQLKFNAKVGIGYGFGNYPTTAGSVNISNYNLFVKGGILTEELRVSLQTTWADYVFNKDYKLPSLTEVENYIKENGHLINVPSAKEVKEDGIELGEMTKIQQEKIEELTLYIIELNKKLEAQEARLKTLENNQ